MASFAHKGLVFSVNDPINGYLPSSIYRLIISSMHYSNNLGCLTTDPLN